MHESTLPPAVSERLRRAGITVSEIPPVHARGTAADAETESLAMQVQDAAACEALAHAAAVDGHDCGPARFAVTVRCPECTDLDTIALLCAGRVLAVTSSLCTMRCPHCGVQDEPWELFWRSIEVI